MILLLLACAPKEEPHDTAGLCRGSPTVTILAPTEGQELTYGERVELSAEGTSTIGEDLTYLWGVGGDVVNVGETGAWTPDVTGAVEITLQVEDSCGLTQTSVGVRVIGGDTGA